MTSSIQETVNTALQSNGLGSYMSHARPVVASLQDREAEIAESLIGFATSAGMPEVEATAAIREAGLYMPPPPAPAAVPAPGTIGSADEANQGGDLADVLNRINETLTSLAQFARSNGWRG